MVDWKKIWMYLITDPKKVKKEQVNFQPQKPTPQRHMPVQEQKTGLKKLTTPIILFILINAILGSSLFFLPGLGVISSGAASIIAWVLLFVIASIIVLYVGELITLYPTSGGTYEFCKHAYGRFGSFMAGWLIWIAGNFGMALNIVAAAEYFIPQQTQGAFILRIIFAVVWILVLNYLVLRGVDAGITMLVVFGVIATGVVAIMTLPSFIDVRALFSGAFSSPFDVSLMKPFFRHDGLSIFTFMGLSLLLISEAFLGFEVVSYMGNEVKNPKRLHKTLFWGVGIAGAIMALYILSSLGTVRYFDYVNNLRPFAVQAMNTMGPIGEMIVVFGMYIVIIGAAAAWPITGSRLLQAMAKDKLFVQRFAGKHKKHGTPHKIIYFQTVMVFLFSWFIFRGYLVKWGNPYRTVYLIYVVISLIVISMILLAVPILRRKNKTPREYKAPLGNFVPYVLVLLFIGLIFNWVFVEGAIATSILWLALGFIVAGLPFYFFVEMLYNQTSIVRVNETFSFMVAWTERFFFPFSIRNKLLKDMSGMAGKKILEYGCSVGIMTQRLAPLVGPSGKVIALDLSLKKTKVADRRTKHIDHVDVFHHPHLDDFRLNLTEKVDGVVSVGMLSYMQQPERILWSLGQKVKKGGEIVFVDYDKFFWFIPNVKWIESDEKLKLTFRKGGFLVDVTRKRGLLWQYIVVTGKRV